MFGFNFEFPYTNFHDLNMDWILRNIGVIWSKMVQTVNGIAPDEDGNVNVGTVKTVNGFSPDSNGEVKAGTIRSVNGVSPTSLPTPGSITLTPMDIGAVKTVNNTSPDAAGNVNLPTVAGVTSVCGQGADGSGNVALTASDVGALPDTIDPVETINNIQPDAAGDVAIKAQCSSSAIPDTDFTPATGVTNDYTRVNKRNVGIISLVCRFTMSASMSGGSTVMSGFPVPSGGIPMYFIGMELGTSTPIRFFINSYGELQTTVTTPAGQYEIAGCYIIGAVETIPIVASV